MGEVNRSTDTHVGVRPGTPNLRIVFQGEASKALQEAEAAKKQALLEAAAEAAKNNGQQSQ